ncbi:MAG: cyclic nucleotide-binding domain-containing protein [Rhodospirillaceae bacterium]|nr:cyclic nucleotide-binding domain-containing protein [Rhodospirillaceae bacterium]MBT4220603.1 cyclic nucleotide-binding domain-containing protein [Rhodospirillaceae bacterium]MBT5013563.1 cyclic nucleotide-binding domain-containing protein [Rhodospirillaceae bacterium]MBT7355433.1 cyclic nucleotide-binding domain-containing protein [Rhodospirillaceae bacterium]
MKKTERKYKNGELVFRESEASSSVFVVVKGNVELTKSGEMGSVMLAMLGPDEMFGEMGILDKSRRSATATAVGTVVLEETSRDDFMDALSNEPGLAKEVMAKLVERLRAANERLAHPTTVEKPTKSGGGSMFELIRRMVSSGGSSSDRIEIRVAPLFGEEPGAAEAQTKHVVQSLGKRKHIRVRAQKKMPDIDPELHPDDRMRAIIKTAHEILADTNSDLMIWGDIPPPGTTIHLHFISAVTDDDDRPGCMLPMSILTLPVGYGPELAELLLAVALAATVSKNEDKRIKISQSLSEALYAAMPAVQSLPHDLTTRERSAIQMCYGNAVATMAAQRGTADLYQVAAQTYRAALDTLQRDDNPLDWAMTNKHLGAVLQAMSERNGGAEALAGAAEAFAAALEVFTRSAFPVQWASIQNRLGVVLFKIDLKGNQGEMIKESLNAFQAAVQVFTRTEYPDRWAEVMNNFAQAAQVLGEQLHNAEVLEKATEACRGALEIRTREKGPVLWAATQNNLGSGLFLLGKLNEDDDDLRGAAEAFAKAVEVYREFSLNRLARVAEKNLARVTDEIEQQTTPQSTKGNEIPELHWEAEDENKKSG